MYKNNEITLKKGDKLFLYTDGIPEATNNKNEMFGIERMVNSLNNNFNKDMADILKNVKKDVDKFANGAVQFDDLTMLGIEYRN